MFFYHFMNVFSALYDHIFFLIIYWRFTWLLSLQDKLLGKQFIPVIGFPVGIDGWLISLKIRETQKSLWMALIASEEFPVAGLARFRSSKSLGERSSSACCLCGYSQVKIWWSILIIFSIYRIVVFSARLLCSGNHEYRFNCFIFQIVLQYFQQWIPRILTPYKQFCKCSQMTCRCVFQIMVNLIIYVLHMDLEYFRNII